MKLDIRATAISAAVIWGLLILLTGMINLMVSGYGELFLNIMASLYPGYDASGSMPDLFAGFIYALVDGGICGLLFAFLYNLFLKNKPDEEGWKKRQPGFDTPPLKPEA